MEGTPWREGMATTCGVCQGKNLEHLEDGSARCRDCGQVTPRIWAAQPAPSPPPPPSTPPPGWAYPPVPPYAPSPPYPYRPYKSADFATIFGDTFRLFFKHPFEFFLPYFLLSLGLAFAVFAATLTTIGPNPVVGVVPFDPTTVPTGAIGIFILFLIVIVLVFALVSVIVQGGVTHFAVLRHRETVARLGESFALGVKRILSLIGAALLVGLILLGLFSISMVPLFLGLFLRDLALLGVGLLALLVAIPVAIFLYLGLSLFPPAIMMEGLGAIESLRRSWHLTKGRRLSLFGVYFVIGLIAGAVSVAITIPVGLLGDPNLNLVAQAVTNGLVGSWSVIAAAVAYDLIVSQPEYPTWYGAPWWPSSPAAPSAPRPPMGSSGGPPPSGPPSP